MSILKETRAGEGRRVLVVDDEELVGQIMCQVVAQMGYQVDRARDGDQAIALAKEHEYDVVICDILMPRVNGMALFDIWREQMPELVGRIVFVTGDSLGVETSDFIRRTGCPCIYKPFKLVDLAQTILRLQNSADGPVASVG